jgi:PPM family protein phosphatase
MIRFSAQTHAGKKRRNNEDAMFADPDTGVFLVADGVGGRAAGEVASALTVETFQAASADLCAAVMRYAEHPEWSSRNDVLELIDDVCQRASARVYDESEASGREGMTTTMVAIIVGGGAAFLAHVGDSRAYLLRDGLIRQLTEDHSMVNELVRTGQMTYEEARRSRYRSVITRAIGLYPSVQADVMSIEILPGDRLVLNSDGLSDPVKLDRIEEISCQDDVDTSTRRLIDAALDAGGPDNVTVVMVEPEATPQTEAARARAQVMSELFLFAGLPFHARLRVSRICQELFFKPNQPVVEEGSIGDALYVIVQGEVTVTRAGVELASLGAGEHFGELGLLEDQQRSASVSGVSYGSAIVIQRAQLQEFCQREPALGNQILWRLLHTLGHRLRDSNTRAARWALDRG